MHIHGLIYAVFMVKMFIIKALLNSFERVEKLSHICLCRYIQYTCNIVAKNHGTLEGYLEYDAHA